MSEESVNDDTFKEYRPLGPKHRTLEHYVVIGLHVVAAVVISWSQLSSGLTAWFSGFGVLTPILLIINGFVYSSMENDPWYKEEMVPFINRIITTTEIETDRYRQYHRQSARVVIVFGWFNILICQFVWTFCGTQILPYFIGDDLVIRIVGELVAYAVLFGPFFLYFGLLFVDAFILDKIFQPRYNDIFHLLEIENKWSNEDSRRAEAQKAAKKDKTPK